ncbi:MAG TPA: hypothetical protein VNN12_09425 [Dehalococcoidia bacterium]|nr:hypothetical protein [Dehalococcoidia bacterium]
MSPRRRWSVLAAGVTGVLTIASAWALARRIDAHHAAVPRTVFAFQPVLEREFEFAGRPVRFVDEFDGAGQQWVRMTYADQTLRLRVAIPGEPLLPGLMPHEKWMRVLRFAPISGMSIDELAQAIRAGRVTDRLVVVTREPRPGTDPDTWGEVLRTDWVFGFHELLPDGTIASERLHFPESERALKRRQDRARREGRPVPERRPDELREGTWQFQAALAVMPAARGPAYTFEGDAYRATGWTLPVCSLAMIGFVVSLTLAAMPDRRGPAPNAAP